VGENPKRVPLGNRGHRLRGGEGKKIFLEKIKPLKPQGAPRDIVD